jgi:hypothetical protein
MLLEEDAAKGELKGVISGSIEAVQVQAAHIPDETCHGGG